VFALEGKYVAETLGLSERALPILWSIHGAGALVAAIGVSRAKAPGGRELRYVGGALILSGSGLVIYMATTNLAVAAIGTAILGAGLSLYFAPAYALIQRASGQERRGRVTGVFEILQETIGFASSVAFATLALPDSAVRPLLAAGGVVIATAGGLGSVAAGRLRRRLEAGRDPVV
jgi:predicted MFS family arabinose efflux permease